MNVKELYQGISNKLAVDFSQIQNQISHSGEKGKLREQAVRDFLQKYLPKKYSVGTGHVLDHKGNISKQADIVIYDAINCPLLLVEDGYQVFPVESVLGVVEIKSVLDATTIADSAENIKSVKCLLRDAPVIGTVFAFDARYFTEPKIEAVANAFRKVNDSILPQERVDLVCVLAHGMFLDYKKVDPPYGSENDSMMVYLETTPPTLLLFLFYLIRLLEQRASSMPDLISYALKGGGEIGLIKNIPSDLRESL